MFDWILNTPQNSAITITFYLYQNIKNAARMTFYFTSEKLLFKDTLAVSENRTTFTTELQNYPVTLDNLE